MRGSKNVLPAGGRVASRERLSDIQRPTRVPSRKTSPCVGPPLVCGVGGGATEGMLGASGGARLGAAGSVPVSEGAADTGAIGANGKVADGAS